MTRQFCLASSPLSLYPELRQPNQSKFDSPVAEDMADIHNQNTLRNLQKAYKKHVRKILRKDDFTEALDYIAQRNLSTY
ncbi:Hypothetical predicted protein [Octopus vulgaris]|uniref:Uncharacterized protein n=1 Tax=Octopus vulgaris TaxID=6645 RepID=A0AA36BHF3_OCTVU|nr:Hypothetical predicted protein [Octopus vulgaris]